MLDLFKAECLKLKGTKILWLSVMILVLTIVLEFYSYAGSSKYSIDRDGWNDYFMSVVILINFLTGYMSYYILTCYIYAREYQEKTHIALFTNPIRRTRIYFSKLLVIYMYIAVSLLMAFVLSTVLGTFITIRPLTFEIVMYQLGVFAKMILMHAMLIPIITFFTIRWKKFVPAIIGMCTVMCLNFVLVNTPGNTFYPWTVPLLFSPHGQMGRTFTYVPGGIISICFIFVLGLFLALRSYTHIEKK
ncbi:MULTISPECIES: ABC transporter permease [Paenibacillus]|jgi:ABC-2 type transport system permease protein/bacitracin transport system permease protein|uniref:ABC transporter permease n=1 Tax=Paenibacillus TaxID=44249 RepID=UPI0008FB6605|nr:MULTISPECIES: ABC transporter permease [Paenibacillus]APB73717.1 ABC transporter permease [Paenibacillus polymyxa]OMF80546.1 ABC transporter permease [Paenibacillus peoriae]